MRVIHPNPSETLGGSCIHQLIMEEQVRNMTKLALFGGLKDSSVGVRTSQPYSRIGLIRWSNRCAEPIWVNKRLSSISSDKESFDKSAAVYQKALADSGHETYTEIPARTKYQHREEEHEKKKDSVV